MLKIRKPRDSRQRQTPAKKAGVFEHKIDALGLEFRCSRPIETEHERPSQARTAPVKNRRLHDFDPGALRESRKFGAVVIHPGEYYRPDFTWAIPVQCIKKIA